MEHAWCSATAGFGNLARLPLLGKSAPTAAITTKSISLHGGLEWLPLLPVHVEIFVKSGDWFQGYKRTLVVTM